jgi:hypothetical protein
LIDGSFSLFFFLGSGNMGKPYYPYSVLIRFAILGSANKALYLQEIYRAIEERYPSVEPFFRSSSTFSS